LRAIAAVSNWKGEKCETWRYKEREIKILCKNLQQNNKETVPSGALTLCLWSIFTPNKDTTQLLLQPLFPLGACNFSGNMLKSQPVSAAFASSPLHSSEESPPHPKILFFGCCCKQINPHVRSARYTRVPSWKIIIILCSRSRCCDKNAPLFAHFRDAKRALHLTRSHFAAPQPSRNAVIWRPRGGESH